jgi:polysaccharide biosynthesis transport protein
MPLMLAGLVILLTREPKLTYNSSTVLYTGLATGSSIEMEKTFNYFATNSAFDNLINIIKSRETQEEVAIRLLSQHLLLPKADAKYIAPKFYAELKDKIPEYINAYVSRIPDTINYPTVINNADSTSADSAAMASANSPLFPASINRSAYEKTVANLTALMKSSDTNFVYKLLNYEDEHYSIKAISSIKAERIANSDLIKLSYEVNDPGICQQTLAIFNEVCIKNYKHIKENRSDAVVKYFESQLILANAKLKDAEDKLLGFNKSNNIINYYEQSKAVAVVKEDMEVDYNNKKAQLAGTEAATKKLEEKLNIQQLVQVKSNNVLEKRKELGDINYDIATSEAETENADANAAKIVSLRKKAESLKGEIKKSVGDLYSYQNSVEGLPVSTTLSDWINNVIESENLKAKLKVMDQRNKDFQQQYAIYAPAGANIKRIEREISVSEQGYLELLHGLNLAKLKLQDNELTSNLKAVDPPYFPLQSMPTKRAVLVIAAALIGFILVLGSIMFMEYLDDTLKNAKKASAILNLPSLGMVPKILLNSGKTNLPFVQNRLVEITAQNMEQFLSTHNSGNAVKTILFISTMEKEGKSVVSGNIAKKLIQDGKKVLVLNYSKAQQQFKQQRKFPILNRLLGYQDPRINFSSPFLTDPASYLQPATYLSYNINEQFYKAKDYTEILEQSGSSISFVPDYVFIELPALIYNNYPASLVSQADMSVLVCRSNRLWSEADQSALDGLLPLAGKGMNFIINGVELKEVESLLGDLPKKSSTFRKKIKNLFRFQFFSKTQI